MKVLEWGLWIAGIVLLVVYCGSRASGELDRQNGLRSFTEARFREQHLRESDSAHAAARPTISVQASADAVIAVLRIPRIALEVPTYYGTSETQLRRGAGLVEGTAAPGSNGNVVIAAHRDTFFRGLKDVATGDLIELESLGQTRTYRIAELLIVEPSAVEVMAENGQPWLTLITCYPFYFVGHAPQRFIVRALANDYRPTSPPVPPPQRKEK